jgi:site-specific DNA-methyltransferase (adenine-specific)
LVHFTPRKGDKVADAKGGRMKYQIVLCDPPWRLSYVKETKAGFNVYDLPYSQMSDKEIMSLPVKRIIDKNAILFMWVIDSRIKIIKELFVSWGFEYKTCAFVWNKIRKDGNGVNANLGMYSRKSCEFLFVGTKGKCLAKYHTQNQYFPQPKREHSRKPDEIRDMIVKMCGDLPRIELFARQVTPGWDAIGYDIDRKDIKDSLGEIIKKGGYADKPCPVIASPEAI